MPPAGTIRFTNAPLRVLIRNAYQVDAYAESYKLDPGPYVRIIGSPTGGPQPDVPRFDVQGKPPDNSQPPERRAMMRALPEDRPDAPADFSTVFTALPEQLGLKLEPRQAPVEVLVVDSVELPTPD